MTRGNESGERRSQLVKFNAPEDMRRDLAAFALLDNEPINGILLNNSKLLIELFHNSIHVII